MDIRLTGYQVVDTRGAGYQDKRLSEDQENRVQYIRGAGYQDYVEINSDFKFKIKLTFSNSLIFYLTTLSKSNRAELLLND